MRLFHKKYIEQVLQSVISEALPEVESYAENDERHFYPYALQDGGYFVLMGDTRMDVDHYSETKLITGACLAYGVKPSRYSCDEVDSENKCTEIADFASELTQKSCNGALEASECKITCD